METVEDETSQRIETLYYCLQQVCAHAQRLLHGFQVPLVLDQEQKAQGRQNEPYNIRILRYFLNLIRASR